MIRPQDLFKEIQSITTRLIGLGISDSQNHPSIRQASGDLTHIDVAGCVSSGIGFGRASYRNVYEEIDAAKAYNAKLLDGGLLVLQYTFDGDLLIAHRLAFWASPSLESFQNEPELYETDELYLDFLDPSIVPFPIRFDFGLNKDANAPIVHPRSHLTLGQYQNCRIPVSSPVSPSVFVDFVLRNFYSNAYRRFVSVAEGEAALFDISLYEEEKSIPHLVVARSAHGSARPLRKILGLKGKAE